MKNMKIKGKMLMGFMMMAVLALAVGGFGIHGLLNMGGHINVVGRAATNAISISELEGQLKEQRVTYMRGGIHLLIDDNASANSEFKNLQVLDSEFRAELQALDDALEEPEARAYLDDLYTHYKVYAEIRDEFTAAAQAELIPNDAILGEIAQIGTAMNEVVDVMDNMVDLLRTNSDGIAKESRDEAKLLLLLTAVIIVFVISVGVIMGIRIASMVSKPVTKLVAAAKGLSVGNIDVELDIDSKDEMGTLAAAFMEMADGIRQQSEILVKIADGDFRDSINVRSESDIMNKSINTVVRKNNETFHGMRDAALQVSAGAAQIATGAQNLAAGSSRQAATLEEFTASVNELSKKSEENTGKSMQAFDAVQESSKHMVTSMESMRAMTEAMQDINESASNIAKVIKVIDDIAFQTNILALNAAVEAARAGQHGKGFAVVADEVRNLASKSAEAAKETAALIENSTEKVAEGNSIAKRTGENLERVNAISEKNADVMHEISTSSEQQSDSISHITIGINNLSDVVQANSATAQQSAAAAEELSAQASMLEELMRSFKLNDTEYSTSHNERRDENAAALPAFREGRQAVIDLGSEYDKY
ncbi:MAG: methyl-accepting chemotaxis protein [Clostridiales Family XIII bacterium]|jgi:methyl-accepting chemotaxis protein|nr:methyl-accepting chemotaxis protein [Clostridiales Family XIII bacterium]